LEKAFAIQAALAAFPPPKAAPQASRLRLVQRRPSFLAARFNGLSSSSNTTTAERIKASPLKRAAENGLASHNQP